MLRVNKILLARDLTKSAEQATHVAFHLALQTGAELHVLYAEVLFEDRYQGPKGHDELLEDAKRQLAHRAQASSGDGASALIIKQVVVRDVAAAPAILDYTTEHDIDLVVIGTHGRRGLRRMLLGSVAEEVIRLSPVPVLTVHPRDVEAGEGHAPRSILVPIDFSVHAAEALRQAKQVALLYGARLDLLHVVEEQMHPAFYNTGVVSVYDLNPHVEEDAILEMERLYRYTEGPGGEVTYTVLPGHAANEIVRFAEIQESNLIVMATHGLMGLEHMLMGSVAERVVRRAPCPVLSLKSFGKSLSTADPTPGIAHSV